jgi:hypothetical protein
MGYTPEEHSEEMARRAARAFEPEALDRSNYRDEVLGLASDIKKVIGIDVDLYLLEATMIEIYTKQVDFYGETGEASKHIQIPVRNREGETVWLDIQETSVGPLEINPIEAPEDPTVKVVML